MSLSMNAASTAPQADPAKPVEIKAVEIPADIRAVKSRSVPSWVFRLGIVLAATLWLVAVATSWAEAALPNSDSDGGAASPASPASPASEDYSFKWLDPEKKIYVLQNRRYRKANRMLMSAMLGPSVSNPYRSSYNVEPRLAFYFSESWGIEGFYTKSFNSQNNTFKALVSTGTTTFPVVREAASQMGALLHWVPWYSKINVFNKILYFDWYFSGGLGSLRTSLSQSADGTAIGNEDLFSIFAGTGHQYHLSEVLSFRLDFMGTFYRAPIYGTTGDQTWYSNYNFGVGLGWRL